MYPPIIQILAIQIPTVPNFYVPVVGPSEY